MTELATHQYWMRQALIMAKKAYHQGEIPVGALIIDRHNRLVAQAHNQKEINQDATAHAEILVIQRASQKLKTWRLSQCTLYVTLEPCPMCAGAIVQARLQTLVYGVDDFKTGAIRTVFNLPDSACSNHSLQVFAGIEAQACQNLLTSWFQNLRLDKNDRKFT